MTDDPVDLDSHRGMAAQKSTEARRHLQEVEADHAIRRHRQEAMDEMLSAAPAETWVQVANKARYLLELYAASPDAVDPRRQRLIASVLDDFDRLSHS